MRRQQSEAQRARSAVPSCFTSVSVTHADSQVASTTLAIVPPVSIVTAKPPEIVHRFPSICPARLGNRLPLLPRYTNKRKRSTSEITLDNTPHFFLNTPHLDSQGGGDPRRCTAVG